jgi:hypothetical protein
MEFKKKLIKKFSTINVKTIEQTIPLKTQRIGNVREVIVIK